jgi:hypothetical protein
MLCIIGLETPVHCTGAQYPIYGAKFDCIRLKVKEEIKKAI